MEKSYFITGASGFVGQAVINQLLSENPRTKIYAFLLPNDKYIDLLNSKGVKITTGDILNPLDIDRFLSTPCEGEKTLFHIAGRISTVKNGDTLTHTINVDGTKNVFNKALEHKFNTFIYVSSVDSLDKREDTEVIVEQDTYNLDKVYGVYGRSKAIANNYILSNGKGEMRRIIVCPSAIFGPNDPFSAPINIAIHKALLGKIHSYVEGGYDIVDVRDVAQGIINADKYGKDENSYLLTGHYISVKDLMNICCKEAGRGKARFKVPHALVKAVSPFVALHAKRKKQRPLFTGFSMSCLIQNSNYSHEKAVRELGYTSRELMESLSDTIEYYRKEDSFMDEHY